MPAYNAGDHLQAVVDRIPQEVFTRLDTFWIINDGSDDLTKEIIDRLVTSVPQIQTVTFSENRGYGSAVKEGLMLCKRGESDYAVCLHADGQYPPESIIEFLEVMCEEDVDILQGSRIASGTAISGGMPRYKVFFGKILTFCENLVFGLSLTDFHSGFIMYSRKALDTIPFTRLSSSFDIDVELIASAHGRGLKVEELPIPTRYSDEESYLNPITYGFRVVRVMVRYVFGYYKTDV